MNENRPLQRVISLLLCLCLLGSVLPLQVWAEELQTEDEPAPAQGEQPASLQTQDGEVPVEENWDEAYPFGTFAFGSYQADVGEDGAVTPEGETLPTNTLIPVYRLGGTVGSATVTINFAPAITTDPDGVSQVYDYAASPRDDLLVEFENPNPVAAYQTLGVPQWELQMEPGTASVMLESADEPAEDDSFTAYLSEDVGADSFRWQASADGVWKDIQDLPEPVGDRISMPWNLLWDFETENWTGTDLRCIYFVDGKAWCAGSLLEQVYEPIAPPEAMPEDLDTEADPGYTVLENADEYGIYEFDLTFAEGETVKYIRVSALDDSVAELPEFGLFTIIGCRGGELSNMCNTLTLMISDNDEHGPSQLGFLSKELTAERQAQTVKVPVKREGDTSYNITVHYQTVDGTAKAGVDYASAEGDLTFAGSIDEIEIPVSLIANGDTEEKSFDIVLTELRGGGLEQRCSFTSERITVTLNGAATISADGTGQNLATLLTASEADAQRAAVSVSEDALLHDGSTPLRGETRMQEDEPVLAKLVPVTDTRSHQVKDFVYTFSRSSMDYTNEYWRNYEVLLGETFTGYDLADTNQNYKNTDITYGKVLASDEKDFPEIANAVKARLNDPNNPPITTTRAQRNGRNYTAQLITSYWSGNVYFGRDSSYMPFPTGNYFTGWGLDVEWSKPGLQIITDTSRSHHYLLPSVIVKAGSKTFSSQFWVDGDMVDKFPDGQTLRCYTNLAGLTRQDKTDCDDDSNSWEDNPNLNSMVQPIGYPLGWGEEIQINVDLTHKNAWYVDDDENTSRKKGLMDWDSNVDIRRFFAQRHTMAGTKDGIGLTLYTANDLDEAGNAIPLAESSPLYGMLKPTVALTPHKSGVNSKGELYAGSTITVTVPEYRGFRVATDGVFLTNSSGQKVGTVARVSNTEFEVTFMWNGMQRSDKDDTFRLNVVYERLQTIQININPSVPRLPNSTSIDPSKISTTWGKFMGRSEKPSYTSIPAFSGSLQNGHAYTGTMPPTSLSANDFTYIADAKMYVSNTKAVNLQSINFHQDAEDLILFNDKSYPGNATIVLTAADLASENLTFIYYNKEYRNAVMPMELMIDSVEVYLDVNHDGMITGQFADKVFTPTPPNPNEKPDEYIMTARGDYDDAIFKPYRDEDGNLYEYFFKVFYTMTPRCLMIPEGASASDRAQILPIFFSAVTDPDEFKELTEEQKSWRYVQGQNSDGKIMYEQAAAAYSFFDVALGGDCSQVEMKVDEELVRDELDFDNILDCKTTTTYTWKPEYCGNLLVPFSNPTPMLDQNNITGKVVPLAGESPTQGSNGIWNYSTAGRANMNAYYGSFMGRSGFAAGVQEQKKAASAFTDLEKDLALDSTIVCPVTCSTSADNLNQLKSGGGAGEAEGEGPGGDIGAEEFSPGLGTDMPSLEFPLGDFASIIVDGYQVGIAVGFPIFKQESSSYKGVEKKDENYSDPNKEHFHGFDTEGQEYDKYVEDKGSNGKVTTTITTSDDPANPNAHNRRLQTTVVETKDGQGRTTYRTVKQPQVLRNGAWVDDGQRQTSTNNPNTATQTRAQSVKAAWKDGHSQIHTLGKFCDAIKAKNGKELANFLKDQTISDDSYDNAKAGNSTLRKVSVSFTVMFSLMFEFNPIDNCYYFKTGGVSLTLGLEFTAQARFPGCPIFYVYLKLGAQVEVAASFSCYRLAVEGEEIKNFLNDATTEEVAEGKADRLVFKLEKGVRGFHMNLNGKVGLEVYDNAGLSGKPLTAGGLSGDGGQKEVLFEDYGKDIYVKLQAVGEFWPEISDIKPVTKAESKFVFDGLSITPSLSLEVGIGVGVELLKAEIYLKTSIAITMTMGGYLESTDSYEGFYISNFDWSIAFGLNVVFAFISFSVDLIAFGVEGSQNGTGGYFQWDISATHGNGGHVIWSKTTYTTADAKSLDASLIEPVGYNLYKEDERVTFYNADGQKTSFDEKLADKQSWEFDDEVCPYYWWGGGDFDGQFPLNNDLARARVEGASLEFTTAHPKILLYFTGEIDVYDNATNKTRSYTKSPATLDFGGKYETTVKITAKEDAQIDRYCPVTDRSPADVHSAGLQAAGDGTELAAKSLVHISGPRDISGTQMVKQFRKDSRAFDPTGTEDFQLSGYNTSGDAKKLAWGMDNGYTYKIVRAGTDPDNDTFLVYQQYLEGKPQLVLSKLVMTNDLTSPDAGLVHPLNEANTSPYLMLDNDSLMDLDFAVTGDDSGIRLCWISYANAEQTKYSVKTRTIDLVNNTAGEVQTLQVSDDFRSAPSLSGSRTVWVQSSGSGEEENSRLKAWLLATKSSIDRPLTAQMLDSVSVEDHNVSVEDPALASTVFYWATQSELNRKAGSKHTLKTAEGQGAAVTGQVENLETVELGGKTYVLYSTAEAAYFNDDETPTTIGPENFNAQTERAVIRRLYLRTLDDEGFGKPTLLQTVIDFDGCSDSSMSEARLKDGVYVSGALQKTQADPYFSNLRFVTAKLDDTGVQTLALFEMGGNSYLISEADLLKLGSGRNEVTLQPIFSQTTGTEVTIGSDGESLAAVYTAPIANSQSNAIFVAWWNEESKSWGAPTILAMRDLQVYEDRITYDMDPAEAEQAYLGQIKTPGGYQATGDVFTFSNLQMATRTVLKQDGTEGKQLIVLTEGSLTPMIEASFDMGEGKDAYTPMLPDPNAAPGHGFYALAFGAGEQALGEGHLSFASYDFSQGNKLIGEVSFVNTGTVAIRGSEDNPGTVKLMAGNEELASWNITKSIPSGQKSVLGFTTKPLTSTLPSGTVFRLLVQEDPIYAQQSGGTAFSAVLGDLLTVEAKPELSFGNINVRFKTLDPDDSDKALLDFEATVLNNGSMNAGEVFLQFTYGSKEKDVYDRRVYKPVNIVGSLLDTSYQKPIERTPQKVEENYSKGVFMLRDPSGKTNLDINYCRTVTGTLRVPVDCFMEDGEYSGLHLRVEIFSSADFPDYVDNVYMSEHNEYDELNNMAEFTLKHVTQFNVPSSIVTALGTTLTLPASFLSTSKHPDILLTEVSDGTVDWEPRLGICYYDAERQVIVAAANARAEQMIANGQKPTGILQLWDRSTNSITGIAYTIGAMGDGVNIYKDDNSFKFYEPNGNPTNLSASASENPGWLFQSWPSSVGWTCGSVGEIPMNSDLSMANKDNAYLTFQTVATKLTIYYMGQISVKSSEFNNGQWTTFESNPADYSDAMPSGSGQSDPAVIEFHNTTSKLHTVTIKANRGTLIDRYVAEYSTNVVPQTDPDAPLLLWSRSRPDTASLKPGASVPMTCYLFDETGLQDVRFNGQTLSETTNPKLVKVDDGFWYFDYTFKVNGPYNVRVFDTAGNTSSDSFNVAWFNEVISLSAKSDAPGLLREHLGFTDSGGNPVNTTTGTLTQAPYLQSSYAPGEKEESCAYLFEDGAFGVSALGKVGGERWLANYNGYYQVRVDRSDGTWARAFTRMTNYQPPQNDPKPDLEGDGTPTSPYLIQSTDDWIALKNFTATGATAGKYFLQTDDIWINQDFLIGASGSRFSGVYDGGGYRLYIEAETDQSKCAPFANAQDAVFRNLHADGYIVTSNQFAAGICSWAYGSTRFENCRSTVWIETSRNGDGTHGGLLAVADTSGQTVSVIGCLFDGAMTGTQTTSCGGFIGYSRSHVEFRDCIFAPAEFECASSQNFSRLGSGVNASFHNCFYLDVSVSSQGERGWPLWAGEHVTIDAGNGTVYSTSELIGYENTLRWWDAIYGAEDSTADLRLSAFFGDSSDCAVVSFHATDGTLIEERGSYRFRFPAAESEIQADVRIRLTGSGTEEDPYLIRSATEWDYLAAYTEAGYSVQGMYFLQTADIQVNRMVGTGSRFSGVYDGGGHLLDVNLSSSLIACAPFTAIQDATIRHVHTTGTVTGDKHSAGLVGNVYGYNNLIYDCLVESVITTTGAYASGILGHGLSSTTRIEGCVFTGSIYGGNHIGVLWGWSDNANITVVNCLEAGETYTGAGVNPLGIGGYTEKSVDGNYVTHSLIGSPRWNWEEAGTLSYGVHPAYPVCLDFGPADTSYETSRLGIYPNGMSFNGSFYAQQGTTVTMRPGYTGEDPESVESYVASDGEWTADDSGSCTLTMPAKDVTISAVLHEWGEPVYSWSEDYSQATASVQCKKDPNHVFTETVKPNFILIQPSTFETTGIGCYQADFQSVLFEQQRKEVVVPEAKCEGGPGCPSVSFADMPPVSSYMHIPIDWAVLNQITFGTSASTFGPEDSCTRAQFVTFLWRVRGQPEPVSDNNPFTDVKPAAYYYKPVLWAVEQGVTAGTSKTTFSPNSKVTRAQVVTFLWRYEEKPLADSDGNPFKDVKSSAYYYDAVLWAVEQKITSGTSKTTFSPNDNCTRAQCVTFLYREFGR